MPQMHPIEITNGDHRRPVLRLNVVGIADQYHQL